MTFGSEYWPHLKSQSFSDVFIWSCSMCLVVRLFHTENWHVVLVVEVLKQLGRR